MSTVLKVAVGVGCGILAAIAAVFVGCAMLFGYGATKVQEEKEAKAKSAQVKIDEFREERDWFYVDGTVTNTGSAPITYVKVGIDFVTSSGSVVDSDWTYAVDSSPLRPGESRKFTVQQRSSPGVDSARAHVLTD
jgi:hypothetical protein